MTADLVLIRLPEALNHVNLLQYRFSQEKGQKQSFHYSVFMNIQLLAFVWLKQFTMLLHPG